MSDLQCPATVLIARHGEARDGREATDGTPPEDDGALTDTGRGQVQHLVGLVRPRRVAAVYSSGMRRAVESAELAASELALGGVVVVNGLQELSDGDAEDGQQVVRRFTKAIGEIADIHRGETVLVFTHGGVMSLAIPGVTFKRGSDLNAGKDVKRSSDLATEHFLPGCAVAEVEVDADGWRVVSWPATHSEEA